MQGEKLEREEVVTSLEEGQEEQEQAVEEVGDPLAFSERWWRGVGRG